MDEAEIEAALADHHDKLNDPDQGHTFVISVVSRGSGKVVGEKHNTDSNWWSEPTRIAVRAWSLPDALVIAADLPMAAWISPPEGFDSDEVGE